MAREYQAGRRPAARQTSSIHLREGRRLTIGTVGWYVTAILLAIVFFTPFVWLFLNSLFTNAQMSAFEPEFWPTDPQWHYFTDVLTWPNLPISFWQLAWNSIRLALEYSILITITSAMVGFAFARLRGPLKRFWFAILVGTMMIPGIIYVYPQYIMFNRMGVLYSDWPWVIWGISASNYLSFLYRQFFASIPVELEDASIVDGCGYVRMFFQVFLPLSKPAVATAAIFSFQYVWNDYISPSVYLTQDQWTLSVAVGGGSFLDNQQTPVLQLISAAAIYYMIPVVLVFIVCQRFFLSGSLSGSLKG